MTRKKILLWLSIVILAVTVAVVFSATYRKGVPVNNREAGEKPTGAVIVSVSADFGQNSHTDKVLQKIANVQPNFHLTLGDFGYNEVATENEWCSYVRGIVGDTLPFQLISGNHESDGQDGLIEKFVACLPNKIKGVVGEYGKEYYFDYPQERPLARFILISPELRFANGSTYSYVKGTPHYAWLNNAIDSAREAKIPWTIVGMHKDCIRPPQHTCAAKQELMNFLIDEKVDLILQAHAHVYLRSKQLRCLRVNVRGIAYDESCTASNNLSNVYRKQNGSVIVVVGTAGQTVRAIDTIDDISKYFEKIMRRDVDSAYGFVKLSITEDQIRSEYVATEGNDFRDTFIIKK